MLQRHLRASEPLPQRPRLAAVGLSGFVPPGAGGGGAVASFRRPACRAAVFVAAAVLLPSRRARHQARHGERRQLPPRVVVQASVDDLQGDWEDDVGNYIEISGDEANFGDGSGTWKIEDMGGELLLRGTRFTGTPERPSWRFPNGVTRRWQRRKMPTPEDKAWAKAFHAYKQDRMQLRRQLWAAVAAEDFEQAAELRKAWEISAGSLPEVPALEMEARLMAGKRFVPGVCFVHRRYGYRAVIVACEPCCNAPAAWKMTMGVANLPRGELQPFYHCLVDERDRPGGQSTFVGEENIEPEAAAYPVQHRLTERLLVNCEELRGYLPGPLLDEAIRQQEDGSRFAWEGLL